jgi:hypothetical protein
MMDSRAARSSHISAGAPVVLAVVPPMPWPGSRSVNSPSAVDLIDALGGEVARREC